MTQRKRLTVHCVCVAVKCLWFYRVYHGLNGEETGCSDCRYCLEHTRMFSRSHQCNRVLHYFGAFASPLRRCLSHCSCPHSATTSSSTRFSLPFLLPVEDYLQSLSLIILKHDGRERERERERIVVPSDDRSAASGTVAVPRTTSSLGDRSFAAAGPRAWNKLPPPLRRVYSAATFKRQLKTFYIITLLIDIVRRPCCVSALTSP